MQELIGHIAAVVIGGVILLILATIGWRGQSTTIHASQYSAAKAGVLDLVQFVEEDISNIGAGLSNADLRDPAGDYAGGFVAPGSAPAWDFTSSPRFLQFCSWPERTEQFDPTTSICRVVRYEWDEVGTRQVRDLALNEYVSQPIYMIQRKVNGTDAGQSLETLTHLDFVFLDDAGAVTAIPLDVRAIRVEIRALSPLGGGTGYLSTDDPSLSYSIEESRWSRVIRPPNLTRVAD